MRIIKFKVKTKNGEVVRFEEVGYLGFGVMADDRFKAETKELFISCKQGHLNFPLNEITEISFDLEQEKIFIHIDSQFCMKEE